MIVKTLGYVACIEEVTLEKKNYQLCIVSKTYESLKLKTLTVDYSKQSNCRYGLYERHGRTINVGWGNLSLGKNRPKSGLVAGFC